MEIAIHNNIFQVGPEVSGESFFGREAERQSLGRDLFEDHTSLHLVGAPRIGKSSLASCVLADHRDDKNCLQIRICMGECDSAFDFWYALWSEIYSELQRFGLWSETFEAAYMTLDRLNGEQNWYNPMKRALKNILREIGAQGWRLVAAIDEFDAVTHVFGQTTAYYQLLRSIFSSSEYALNGVLISRRTLPVLEKKTTYVSSFANVFPPSGRLQGFNGVDMEAFYAALAQYGVTLAEDGKERLHHYTGNIPFLCCMFARQLVRQGASGVLDAADIDAVRSALTESIHSYYKSLIERLRDDQQLDPLLTLIYVKGRPINSTDRDELIAMGVLQMEGGQYSAYSQDFTTYLSISPLNLSTWDLIISAEQKLKEIVKLVYPELGEDIYGRPDRQEAINKKYPHLNIRWGEVEKHLRDLRPYIEETPALSGLGLGFLVDKVINDWKNFSVYFLADNGWKDRLKLIKKVRNPLFHGQTIPLTETELAACNRYCEDLLRLDLGKTHK